MKMAALDLIILTLFQTAVINEGLRYDPRRKYFEKTLREAGFPGYLFDVDAPIPRTPCGIKTW